jgi:hypothetical protein
VLIACMRPPLDGSAHDALNGVILAASESPDPIGVAYE